MTNNHGSTMVEVRLIKEGTVDNKWENIPIASYLPSFLSGEQNTENINKRLQLMYFKRKTDIVKIRWNIQGEADNGVWLNSPFYE